MKGIFTRRNIWIVAIVGVIALSAVIFAFATGNTKYPGLENADEVFYQRLDKQGNVVYSITNEELFETMKSNSGIEQLLYMTDTYLLSEYIKTVDSDKIDEKILELTYGTSDQEIIDEFTEEQVEGYEQTFAQRMTLAGYLDNERTYAKLIIARENFARDYADENGLITNYSILNKYLNYYYGDISAIKIRFTSDSDAKDVMHKFNLVSTDDELRSYLGFIYVDEDLTVGEEGEEEIVQAVKTVKVFYFDENDNLVNLDDKIIYTNGSSNVYTDSDDNQYILQADTTGNLVDDDFEIIVNSTEIFETKEAAEAYKESNTFYYSVTRVDPFDMNETINVVDELDNVVYTIDPDGDIWEGAVNVTDNPFLNLTINKVYTNIDDVKVVSDNISSELSTDEILAAYIKMYNYVYGEYRTTLNEAATAEDLINSANEDLMFNYEDLLEDNSSVAGYLFGTLTLDEDGDQFTINPKLLADSSNNYYYMMFKLDEAVKEEILDELFEDVQATVVIPTTLASTYSLPTTTYYNGSIAWSSDNSEVITSTGTVTNPEADTEVELTYTITLFGETKSYNVRVTVKAENAENETVTEPEYTELTLSDLITDQTIEGLLNNDLLDDYIIDANDEGHVNSALAAKRLELGIQIYDRYLELDYLSVDPNYVSNNSGDKNIIISFDKTFTSEEAYSITVDEFFDDVMDKNAALYLLYAAQQKEMINSAFYTEIYGEERDVTKNKSDAMDKMYEQVTSAKSQYSYYEQLYAQMGSSFPYDSFGDYSYATFGSKTEFGLLEYFTATSLQAHLIQETIEDYSIIEALLDTVEEYYDNYFEMYVTHLLIHVDFDEDGDPDDYYEYRETLVGQDLIDFDALVAGLEFDAENFDGTLTELVTEYNQASRDDETWGAYKQAGFLIITQDLNYTDDDGNVFARTYHGENTGSKDLFVEEFTTALIALYDDYSDPLNIDKDEMISDIVETDFGMHLIKVTKGTNFERPSAEFPGDSEEDPADYSTGSVNTEGCPSLEQLNLYAQYFFYSMVYDLTDADIEDKYDIVVPNLPVSVTETLDVYFQEILTSVYVVGTLNLNMVDRLVDGEFKTSSYTDATNEELMADLQVVYDIYFDAILSDYFPVAE